MTWSYTGITRDLFRRLFFFQAEDGIRDFHVTGVQTCALPISQQQHGLVRRDPAAHPEHDPHVAPPTRPGRPPSAGAARPPADARTPRPPAEVRGVRAQASGASSGSAWIVSRPALISRIAIDSGFSWLRVSSSGPTFSSRPSLSCE